MLLNSHFRYMILFSFFVVLLNGILFGSYSVDDIFLFGNIAVVIFCVSTMYYCQSRFLILREKVFVKKIFWFSFGLRVFAVFFYYILFQSITGTEFDVEAKDAIYYDWTARIISDSILNGTFSLHDLISQFTRAFDDSGYIIFLSLSYAVFTKSVIIVRLLHALLGALTVVLIYRVSESLFDEKTAKVSAIIAATFHPLLLYVSLHLKETIMVYFLFLFIYQSINILKYNKSIRSVLLLIFCFVALLSFRTVLGLIAFLSLVGYLIINNKGSVIRRLTFISIFAFGCIYFLYNIDVIEAVSAKTKRYAGIEVESVKGGGRSLELYKSRGQNIAKYLSAAPLMTQIINTPYPSMVKTNIAFYNQTLQWYFAGGLLLWSYLSFYAIVGLYYSIKYKLKTTSILLIPFIIYTVALIISVYIMSIRYNIVKLALLIPFVGYGIIVSNKRIKRHFIKYAFLVSIITLMWNYLKLSGRGLM